MNFLYSQPNLYGMGAQSLAYVQQPTFMPQQSFGQPYLPPAQIQMPDIQPKQDLYQQTQQQTQNASQFAGGIKDQASSFVKSLAMPALEAFGASMGIPPGLTSAIAGNSATGKKDSPKGLLSIPELNSAQIQQFDRPQQVANGSTQYLQSLQGLLY
jgi:hypothetical protein